jgi:hypothetical protein
MLFKYSLATIPFEKKKKIMKTKTIIQNIIHFQKQTIMSTKTVQRKLWLCCIAVLISFAGKAQLDTTGLTTHSWRCGNDSLMFANIINSGSDSLIKQMISYNHNVISQASSTVTPGTYTVPVVFHIILPTTSTVTISYAQIQWQVAALNAAFQNQMQQFTGIAPGNEASNTNIQFQLACIPAPSNISWTNPNQPGVMVYHTSDPTNTILNQIVVDPTSSATTYTALLALTHPTTAYFPSTNYLNIYCVPNISPPTGITGTVLGFSTFPWYNITSGNYTFDGIVLRLDALGNNTYPTNFPLNPNWNQGFTLAHEAGHYCGLYHTFQPGINNALNYPVSCYGLTGTYGTYTTSAYQDGDQVFDTPPTEITYDLGTIPTINTCNENYEPYQTYGAASNPTLPDQNDQLENFMCYSHDTKLNTFTKLQAQRMWGAFDPNFGAAPRSVLTSTANLAATGVLGWPTSCAAESGIVTGIFNYSIGANSSCSSVNVQFTNPTSLGFSTPSTTTYSWTFGDGSPTYTTTASPINHTYTPTSTSYTYPVSCTATNGTVTNTYSTTISLNFNVSIIGQSSQTGSVTTSNVCAGVEQTIYIQFPALVPSAVITNGTNNYVVTNYMNLNYPEVIPYLFTTPLTSSTVSYSMSPASCNGNFNGSATFNVINCCPTLITNGNFESTYTTSPTFGFATDLYYTTSEAYYAGSQQFGDYDVDFFGSGYFGTAGQFSPSEILNATGKVLQVDGFAGHNTIVDIPATCNTNPTPAPRVWQQTVTGLLPNTPYFYSFKILENYEDGGCGSGGLNFETSIASSSINALPAQTFTPAIVQCSQSGSTKGEIGWVVYTYTFTTPSTTTTSTTFSITINQVNNFYGTNFDYMIDNITLNQMTPGVQAIGTATICPTATVQLNALSNCSTGSYNYFWSPATALTSTVIANPVANPITTTVYTLTAVSTSTLGTLPTYVSTVTVTVNSAPSISVAGNTAICPGVSSVTLTAGGASTYTWSPGGATTASVVVTPTVNTIYTVSGSNMGCTATGTQTVAVTVNNSTTAISVSPSSINLCSNAVATDLTASGATTYTWYPASVLNNPNSATIIATPVSNTIYTVTGTYNGCVGTNTVSVSIVTAPVITLTATPNIICLGQTLTVTASGATTYTWYNGATTPSITVSPNSNSYLSVNASYTDGCNGNAGINVYVEQLSVSATSNAICIGQSTVLSASGASSYTWSPAGTLSGSTGASVTATPSTTTTYTLSGIASGCTSVTSKTITVTVNPYPTLTVTPTNTTVCTGSSTTITATGATNYTWTPSTGLSCTTCSATVSTPTTTGVNTYSVMGANSYGCVSTLTSTVSVYPTSCSGTLPSSYTITSSNNSTVTPVYLANNLYIGTPTTAISYTINTEEVKVGPNYSITVVAGNTLTISNSWLHACVTCSSQQMWEGIVVQNGASLIVTNSIIEDAKQAVYTASSTTTTPIPYLSVSGNIFNNNSTGIYIDSHQGNLGSNFINGNLFTCRSLASHATASIASTFTNIEAATPLYPSSANPTDHTLAGARTQYGIYINAVNVSYPVIVGSDKPTPNLFDNMDYGIYAYQSSLTSKNNIFDNLTGNSSSTPPTGVGIYSNPYVVGRCSGGPCVVKAVLQVGNAGTSPKNQETNYFNNCLIGVYTNDMPQVYINNNVFNNETTATTFSTSGSYVTGQYGVYNSGFAANPSVGPEEMIFSNNNIQNYAIGNFLDFGILTNTVVQTYSVGGGSACIYNNTISGAGLSNNYCNTGFYLQQSNAPGTYSTVPVNAISVTSNSITNVGSNCINITSVGSSTTATGFVSVSQNTLTVQYNSGATTLNNSQPLSAVNINNSEYVKVSNNPVVGTTLSSYPATNPQFIGGIYVTSSPGTRINCNTVSGVGEGFIWCGTSHLSTWYENTISNSRYGLVLRSAGIMDNQGSPIAFPNQHHCGDQFSTSSLTSAQTLCDNSNPGISGSTSILYNLAATCASSVTTTYLPCVNSFTNTPSVAYTATGGTVTLSAVGGVGYNTCISEGGNGRMMASDTVDQASSNSIGVPSDSLLQSYLVNGGTLPVYDYETRWAKQYLINKIKPAIAASNTYANAKAFALVDAAMANGNYTTAQTMNNAISPNNVIERNWKQVDNAILKQQSGNTLNQTDVTVLQSIAAQCPLSGGRIVNRARAILNVYYGNIMTYPNDCPINYGAGSVSSRTENTSSGIINTAPIQTVNLYPNPNNGTMMLDYSINDDASLEITDITGNLLGTYNLPATETTMKVQSNNLQNGMYLYRVISNNVVIKLGKIVVMQQ